MQPITIRPRRATANEWKNNGYNEILRKFEIAVVQNNDADDYEPRFKICDGVTPFKDLPYVTMYEAFRDGIIYTTGGL